MQAVLRGLMSREHALLTLQTLEVDLETNQKALADLEPPGSKVFGGDQAKVKRLDALRGDISKQELSIGAAKSEYEKIKTANDQELQRCTAERRQEYMQMVENFGATQVAASERLMEVWVQLAGDLGATPEQIAMVKKPLPAASQPH